MSTQHPPGHESCGPWCAVKARGEDLDPMSVHAAAPINHLADCGPWCPAWRADVISLLAVWALFAVAAGVLAVILRRAGMFRRGLPVPRMSNQYIDRAVADFRRQLHDWSR